MSFKYGSRVSTAQPVDDRRPHAQVRNEMAVHDIDVDSLGASFFNLENLLAQSSKIRGQD